MTEKDYETYKFIIDYIKEHGYSPSYREIADGVGVRAVSTIAERIHRLEDMGKIKTKMDIPRTISVVGYQFVKIKE